jgi:hypothetical protein
MSSPVTIVNGTNGSERVADTNPRVGKYSAIYINAATVFTTLTGNYGGTVTGITHAAGKWIYGDWKAVTLAEGGDIDLYNR